MLPEPVGKFAPMSLNQAAMVLLGTVAVNRLPLALLAAAVIAIWSPPPIHPLVQKVICVKRFPLKLNVNGRLIKAAPSSELFVKPGDNCATVLITVIPAPLNGAYVCPDKSDNE